MLNQQEIWKDIQGYENKYQISSFGNIRNVKTKHKIKTFSENGYLKTALCENCVSKNYYAHRLVALTFIPNPENKPQINHINGIKTDNRVENLEWCTPKENISHAIKKGLSNIRPNAKLSTDEVLKIRSEFTGSKRVSFLAEKYNVSDSTIWSIVSYSTWKNI